MPRPESRAVTALLAVLSAFGPMSTDLYLPALPRLEAVFAAPVSRVQLTLSVFILGFAFSQLVYGSLSDRYGRRPVLLGGLFVYALASGACALAPSIEALIVARFFQAVGACAAPVLARAVVRDVHGPKDAARILAMVNTAMALAPALAPILGGYITIWFDWRANFAFLAAFGVAALAAVWFVLAETNRHRDLYALAPRRMAGYFSILVRDRAYMGYVLTLSFGYSALFAFISGSPFVLIEVLGLRPERFGFAFAILAGGYMLGNQLGMRLVARFGMTPVVRAGIALVALSGLATACLAWGGVARIAAVVAPQAMSMVGLGFVVPNGMAAALASYPRMAGLASAILGFIQMSIAAAVGALVGHLHDGTALPMTTTIAVVALLAALSYAVLVPRPVAGGLDRG